MHPADPRVALLRDHLAGQVLVGTGGVRFHLRELIGEGGQGWVYQGSYDAPDGVPIVVKVLRPDAQSDDALRRFEREAAVLRRLGAQNNPNPNLVRFFDHAVVRVCPPNSSPLDSVELPFTVLEYVHGNTLAQLLREQGGRGLDVPRVRRLLRQVSWALHFVHTQQVIHRDLKPSNVLITVQHDTEVVKVTDFGLVKVYDGPGATQMLAGASMGYAPPEQYERGNQRVGPSSDVFSFAVILYECLTGAPAYACGAHDSPLRVVERMVNGPRPALAGAGGLSPELALRPELVAALDRELAQATRPQPEERTGSVRAFWEAVEPLLQSASDSQGTPKRAFAPHLRENSGAPRAPDVVSEPVRMFRPTAPRLVSGALHRAVMAVEGDQVRGFALGTSGLYRLERGGWSVVPLPRTVDPASLAAMALLPMQGVVVCGDRGALWAVSAGGEVEPWAIGSADIDWRGVLVEPSGVVLVGGERASGCGVCIDAPFGRTPTSKRVPSAATLRSVARLRSGALVACGDGGALARIDVPAPAPVPWAQSGHLTAISPGPMAAPTRWAQEGMRWRFLRICRWYWNRCKPHATF